MGLTITFFELMDLEELKCNSFENSNIVLEAPELGTKKTNILFLAHNARHNKNSYYWRPSGASNYIDTKNDKIIQK